MNILQAKHFLLYRYEGEFEENNMSGFGVYVWGQEGSVYRGQWSNSMMNGCGVKITRQPNGSYLAEEGRFVNDEWVRGQGPPKVEWGDGPNPHRRLDARRPHWPRQLALVAGGRRDGLQH